LCVFRRFAFVLSMKPDDVREGIYPCLLLISVSSSHCGEGVVVIGESSLVILIHLIA